VSAPLAKFMWYFRQPSQIGGAWAEAELHESSSSHTGVAYHLVVYLVREEMVQPEGGEVIDPANRSCTRVYVGTVLDRHECRLLAHLGSAAASREAYPLIFDAVMNAPEAVERFGDEWLSQLYADRAMAGQQLAQKEKRTDG
jgi:hypothetical protein